MIGIPGGEKEKVRRPTKERGKTKNEYRAMRKEESHHPPDLVYIPSELSVMTSDDTSKGHDTPFAKKNFMNKIMKHVYSQKHVTTS